MTPAQQFRLWARRAPAGERMTAFVGAAAVVAALCWMLVPPSTSKSSVQTLGGVTGAGQTGTVAGSSSAVQQGGGGPAVTSGTAGVGVATGSAGVAGGSAASSTGSSAAGARGGTTTTGKCVSPPGSDQGVSATQIKIAVLLIDAVGPTTSSAFGVPPPAELQKNYQEVIDNVNASGGVACRKLVPQYFTPNAVDQSSLQQTCLDIQQAGVFAVLDDGAYTAYQALAMCYPDNHLPYWAAFVLPQRLRDKEYPYLFSGQGMYDLQLRNSVFAFKQQAFYTPSKGFKKLGIVYRSCEPEYFSEYMGYLHQIGISDSQIDSVDYGCSSSTFANPSTVSQSVLTFRQDGVSDVTFIDDNPDFGVFTRLAQQQGWKPIYLMADENIFGSANASTSPYDANNLDGATGITIGRYGEESTPGLAPTAGTARCNAIYSKFSRPPVEQNDGVAGVACDEVWGLVASIEHAPALQRAALAAGLQATRSLDWSYPYGPNDFSGTHGVTGGEFWRTIQYSAGCHCWKVIDPNFHPSFS